MCEYEPMVVILERYLTSVLPKLTIEVSRLVKLHSDLETFYQSRVQDNVVKEDIAEL